VNLNKDSASPIKLATPKIGNDLWVCPTCGAQATVEDKWIVAVRGTFSRCISPGSRIAAESEDIALRRSALASCPTFNQAIVAPYASLSPGSLEAWLTQHIDRLLTHMRAPAPLRTAIRSLVSSCAQNPPLLVPWLSAIYSIGAIAVGAAVAAGVFVGKAIVVLIPLAVHWLKGSIEDNPTGQLLLCAGLVAIAEIWVRMSRWHPFLFGLVEMGIGLGVAFFGFRDTLNEFAAFFALIGGAFTIIDGRQRMRKE
jgi:hypothetical protein